MVTLLCRMSAVGGCLLLLAAPSQAEQPGSADRSRAFSGFSDWDGRAGGFDRSRREELVTDRKAPVDQRRASPAANEQQEYPVAHMDFSPFGRGGGGWRTADIGRGRGGFGDWRGGRGFSARNSANRGGRGGPAFGAGRNFNPSARFAQGRGRSAGRGNTAWRGSGRGFQASYRGGQGFGGRGFQASFRGRQGFGGQCGGRGRQAGFGGWRGGFGSQGMRRGQQGFGTRGGMPGFGNRFGQYGQGRGSNQRGRGPTPGMNRFGNFGRGAPDWRDFMARGNPRPDNRSRGPAASSPGTSSQEMQRMFEQFMREYMNRGRAPAQPPARPSAQQPARPPAPQAARPSDAERKLEQLMREVEDLRRLLRR